MSLYDALNELRPAAIHVHDIQPLPAAVAYSASMHWKRRPVRVIYDAHEMVKELEQRHEHNPKFQAMSLIEASFIRDAQQVITVSSEIADILRTRYDLPRTPGVVANAPRSVRSPNGPSIREDLQVDKDTPVVVYSGWIAADRGIGTVIRALPSLPNVHLALVTNAKSSALRDGIKLARKLGVTDRTHILPYVPPDQITQYLSSATVGLIPLKTGQQFDYSLPTKFREYLHAGLPIVASDHTVMSQEMRASKVGIVFKPGNVRGLAKAIAVLLKDVDKFRKNITPELLSHHSWESQVGVLNRTYLRTGAKPTHLRGAQQTHLIEALESIFNRPADFSHTEPWHVKTKDSRPHTFLGVGPTNSAGQAASWASLARTRLGAESSSFAPLRPLQDRPDVIITSVNAMTLTQGVNELGRILSTYTHLIIDGYERLFGPLLADNLGGELSVLARHGIQVALLAHGSDIRSPDRHMRDIPHSYFTVAEATWVDKLRKITERNRTIARESGLPLFVSTPDLLADLPNATWLPLTIDPEPWLRLPEIGGEPRLRVLHRPSRSVPPIKGSDAIVPILESLHGEGLIEYLDGGQVVPHTEMPALVGAADVVVDQIRTGSYGVAAVEAMFAGRVVLGGADTAVRGRVGNGLPIIDVTPDTLEETIRKIATLDREELLAIGSRGIDFAKQWHDGTAAAKVLEVFLDAD